MLHSLYCVDELYPLSFKLNDFIEVAVTCGKKE